jgi:hypothetical protein
LSFSGSYAIVTPTSEEHVKFRRIHCEFLAFLFVSTKTRKGWEAIRPGNQKAFKLPSILAFELPFRDEFIFIASGCFGLDDTKLKGLKIACQSVFFI